MFYGTVKYVVRLTRCILMIHVQILLAVITNDKLYTSVLSWHTRDATHHPFCPSGGSGGLAEV